MKYILCAYSDHSSSMLRFYTKVDGVGGPETDEIGALLPINGTGDVIKIHESKHREY